MPYCEFIIKSYAFGRMDKDKWRHTRKIAFWSMWSNHADPKRFPKTENEFIKLDENINLNIDDIVSHEILEQFNKELQEYNDIVNQTKYN